MVCFMPYEDPVVKVKCLRVKAPWKLSSFVVCLEWSIACLLDYDLLLE